MSGKLVTSRELTSDNYNEVPLIDVSSGVYLLKIDSKVNPLTKKFSWIIN